MAFQRALDSFPTRMLRNRIAAVIDDQVPVNYDAEHRFSFILAENASAIELLGAVFDYVNGDGRALLPRSKRSDISVLGLPDIDEYRSAVGKAFLEDIQETLASVESSVQSYYNTSADTRRPADLIRTISIVNDAFKTIKRFEVDFAKVETAVTEALSDVRNTAQALLGGDNVTVARHQTWEQRAAALPPVQVAFGSPLAATEGIVAFARTDGNAVVWRKAPAVEGEQPKDLIIQTGLDSLTDLNLTFVSSDQTVPAMLVPLGAKRGLQGWVVTTNDVFGAITVASGWVNQSK
jgi:hypothetical protein